MSYPAGRVREPAGAGLRKLFAYRLRSIRMEPVFMILGQSGAASAPGLALDDGLAGQKVDYPECASDSLRTARCWTSGGRGAPARRRSIFR